MPISCASDGSDAFGANEPYEFATVQVADVHHLVTAYDRGDGRSIEVGARHRVQPVGNSGHQLPK